MHVSKQSISHASLTVLLTVAAVIICWAVLYGFACLVYGAGIEYDTTLRIIAGSALVLLGHAAANVVAVGLCINLGGRARPRPVKITMLSVVISAQLLARFLSGIQYIDCSDNCVSTLLPRQSALWVDGLVVVTVILLTWWWSRHWKAAEQRHL